jgi:hypothetical protein
MNPEHAWSIEDLVFAINELLPEFLDIPGHVIVLAVKDASADVPLTDGRSGLVTAAREIVRARTEVGNKR